MYTRFVIQSVTPMSSFILSVVETEEPPIKDHPTPYLLFVLICCVYV